MDKEFENTFVDYVFILPGTTFTREFLMSWTNTITMLDKNNVSYRWITGYNAIITLCRNNLLGGVFDAPEPEGNFAIHSKKILNGTLECNKVVFIDSDMVWDNEAMSNLLSSPFHVTSGVYSYKDQKHVVLKREGVDLISKEELKNHKEPFEVLQSGLGFMACSFESLSSLSYPWFDVTFLDDNNKQSNYLHSSNVITEDVYFCNKLREQGYKIIVDPKILVGHQKSIVLEV